MDGLLVNGVNGLILLSLVFSGVFHKEPYLWLESFVQIFIGSFVLQFGTALPFQLVLQSYGTKIQTHPSAQPDRPYDAIIDTIFGHCWIVAGCLAWSVTNYKLGIETAYKFDVAECVPEFPGIKLTYGLMLVVYLIKAFVSLMLADMYNYWKHRIFHSRLLWPFHKGHHKQHNPRAWSGLTASPAFGLATFWPLVTFAIPEVGFYMPVHSIIIIVYIYLLNHYLHCGYTIEWVEKVFAPLCIMSSAMHNVHHEKGRQGYYFKEQTFGEMLTLWDWLMETHPQGRYTYSGPNKKVS